ncbi:MAG: lysylphosphatidylglycerol synthase domain-containing protein [Actinomycetota bacterium]
MTDGSVLVASAPSPNNARTRFARSLVAAAVLAVLVLAVWWQRATVGEALVELQAMTMAVVVGLVLLGIAERLIRADTLRSLLSVPTAPSFGRALTIHDVGAAASKGVPLGGPLSLTLRWSIARDAAISSERLAAALVAYGVATTFVTWLLPFAWIVVDVTQRPATSTDIAALAVSAIVLTGSVVFWAVVLTSRRAEQWTGSLAAWLWRPVARRSRRAARVDPSVWLTETRHALRASARRPFGLFGRVIVIQCCGAAILLLSLRGLGVGAELGLVEFARVYFVVTLLSSFVPVPGGVGVVEAGLTTALVAAGVPAAPALGAVLVYRLLTYVTPIVVGAVLYALWRWRARAV